MKFINQKITVMLALLLICDVSPVFGKTIYVDDDAAGNNNGTSWENAYIYLQDALANAKDSDKPVEIRVAQGIYTPDKGGGKDAGDIYAVFNLINGVTIAGGYAGPGNPNERDIELYETILSGDLNGDDLPIAKPYDLFEDANDGSRFDNSYNVVTAINTDETAVLDGFTITGGIASYDSLDNPPQSSGGGLYCSQSSPTIANCIFTYNAARNGGAMFNIYSSPTLISCRFDKNAATRYDYGDGGNGGAIINIFSHPVLTDCRFTGNSGYSGGAVFNIYGSPDITNCRFTQNTARSAGGGIDNLLSNPVLTNCSFEGNSANAGGGLNNLMNAPILTGCTFIANYAGTDGGGIFNEESEAIFTDCTFISNKANSGGALFNDFCEDIAITNCTLSGNSAYQGGGMENWYSELTIANSILSGNASQRGSVIYNYDCNLTFTNCTIVQNATRFYTDYIPKGNNIPDDYINPPEDELPDFNPVPSRLELVNCIIRDEAISILDDENPLIKIEYSNIRGDIGGEGNIDADPLFVNPGHWADVNAPNIVTEADDPNAVWVNGDYHLKSQAGRWDPISRNWVIDNVTSPCIDAGNPNSPLGDEPQPNGNKINMGTYGGSSQASISLPDDNKNP